MAINIDGNGLITLGGTASTQGRVRLSEDTDNGTNYIELTAPASVASDKTITFPDATGTVVISGTTPSLNGITFPATQVASADVNTLDDYEEGSWTPTLGGATTDPSSITYANQNGTYTKVGNIVSVNFNLHTSAISGGSGAIEIQGLPFPCANNGIDIGTAYVYNLLLSPIGSLWTRFDSTGSTALYIEFARNDNSPAGLTIADWPTSKLALVRGNMTYRV